MMKNATEVQSSSMDSSSAPFDAEKLKDLTCGPQTGLSPDQEMCFIANYELLADKNGYNSMGGVVTVDGDKCSIALEGPKELISNCVCDVEKYNFGDEGRF